MLQAHKDGKIWLNSIDLLLPMLTEYAVLEIRASAFEQANRTDRTASAWPSVLDEEPSDSGQVRNFRRRANFLTIFSTRDDRFAYLPDNMPGAGLEKRLLKQAEGWWFQDYKRMEYFKNGSNLAYPDFDPNRWVRRFEGMPDWHYPIDSADPASAPLLMRLLDTWLVDYGGWFRSFAKSVIGQNVEFMFGDVSSPLEGCGGLDGTELNSGVHQIVCWMVETLAGLESIKLGKTTQPLHSNQEILIKVKIDKQPTDEDTSFTLV